MAISSPKILLIGYGKLMQKLAPRLAEHMQVDSVRRSQSVPGAPCIHAAYYGDVSMPGTFTQLPTHYDFIVFCLSPGERNERAYRKVFIDGLRHTLSHFSVSKTLQRIIFVSSTSVYHQDDSSWIDENSPAQAHSFAGRVLREAEDSLQLSHLPATIVRFSGIYGGNRQHLISQVQNRQVAISTTLRLSNRIHEDDCVGFLEHLLRRALAGDYLPPLFLASDDCPVDLSEVYQFIADKINVSLATSEALPTRRTGNKRCSNKRLHASGYALQYPSFKEGYEVMLQNYAEG
jgi:nucleoside-diphosphate-sugar epimerase